MMDDLMARLARAEARLTRAESELRAAYAAHDSEWGKPGDQIDWARMGALESSVRARAQQADHWHARYDEQRAIVNRLHATHQILGTCDWGGCEARAVALREAEAGAWVAVCQEHTAQADELRAIYAAFGWEYGVDDVRWTTVAHVTGLDPDRSSPVQESDHAEH